MSINQYKLLKKMIVLLKLNNFTLDSKMSVPIAYDGTCHTPKKCRNAFSSIGGADKSGNFIYTKFYDLLGIDPVPEEENTPIIKDLMAFTNKQIIKQQLSQTSILAMACSTNFVEMKYAKADCFEPLYQVKGVEFKIGFYFFLVCPQECD